MPVLSAMAEVQTVSDSTAATVAKAVSVSLGLQMQGMVNLA